jgi:hypothetical protein
VEDIRAMGEVALCLATFAIGYATRMWWERRKARLAHEAHLEMIAKHVYGVDRMMGETIDGLTGRCMRKVDATRPADRRAN